MSISETDKQNLSAALDGELSPEEAQALLARLPHEPELCAYLERLFQIRDWVQKPLQVEPQQPSLADSVWQQLNQASEESADLISLDAWRMQQQGESTPPEGMTANSAVDNEPKDNRAPSNFNDTLEKARAPSQQATVAESEAFVHQGSQNQDLPTAANDTQDERQHQLAGTSLWTLSRNLGLAASFAMLLVFGYSYFIPTALVPTETTVLQAQHQQPVIIDHAVVTPPVITAAPRSIAPETGITLVSAHHPKKPTVVVRLNPAQQARLETYYRLHAGNNALVNPIQGMQLVRVVEPSSMSVTSNF